MKNYVVYSNRTLLDNAPKSTAYKAMLELSMETCRQHLEGDWEFIVWSSEETDHQALFRANWRDTDTLWHSEPCNILFIDTDTVFLNPVKIFGRFKNFTLFNYTDPKGTINGWPAYFNCGVRYFPSTMNPELWNDYRLELDRWPENEWAFEQEGLNRMLWSPLNNTTLEECYHPEIAWQAVYGATDQSNVWNNGVNWLDAGIIHYHGSRGNDRIGFAHQIVNIRKTVV